MSIYERFCRFGSRIPILSNVRIDKADRDLVRAVSFLKPLMLLDVRGVIGGGRFLAILAWISVFGFFALMGQSLLVALPVSLTLPVLAYYGFISRPVSIMNGYRLGLSEESDLVFEQFILVFQAGGTIFDAIELVARSKHPYLSPAFQQIMRQAQDGVPPEKGLLEFARNQPSDDLRRYLTGVVSALEQKTDLLEFLSGESYEADMTLRTMNLELESRLLVIAALMTYVPMLLTLALSLTGVSRSLFVLVLAPILVVLNALMGSRFSRGFSSYFDRPRQGGLAPPSQRDIAIEYDDFLNFLILLGEHLKSGTTLEVALPEVRNQVTAEVQRIIDPAINTIYGRERSTREAMNLAAEAALGQRVSSLLLLIAEMCEISAVDAGGRLTRIAGRLVKRSSLAKERESIIAAQRIKVYLLSLTSAIVLGLLVSLSPFLYIGSLLGSTPFLPIGSTTIADVLPLFITILIVTTSSGYQNTRMVNGKRPKLTGVICGLLFWLSSSLAASLLGAGIA